MPLNQGQPSGSSPPNPASMVAAVFSNRSFIDDDSNPPSYHSIYPTAPGKDDSSAKENKPSSSLSTSPSNPSAATAAAAAGSNLVGNLFQNNSNGSQQEPISYDQLYSTTAAASSHYLGGDLIEEDISGRHHFHHHHHISCLPLSSGALVVQHRPASSLSSRGNPMHYHLPSSSANNSLNNRVRKQFHQIFTKGYLLKHFIFISISSMMIILFQIILINNQSILSHLSAGLWCGLANLFTLLVTIITLRYAKVWLLIITIILHFMCLTVSLGSFVVINSVAASRYGSCLPSSPSSSFYNPFYEHVVYEQQQQQGLQQQQQLVSSTDTANCLGSNLKYANIAMIILGATCMVMFVSFFIKLVAAFNNIHSSRESC